MGRRESRNTPPRADDAAILSPVVDLLCVGGLSLLVLIPLLLFGPDRLDFLNIGWLLWGLAVINYAHFMASYRIIYRDREMIRRHQWASIWVPVLLLISVGVAVAMSDRSQVLVIAFFAVASGYLAWHYTGQAWGMMASHAYLRGVRFEKRERILVRTSLRILLAWHVVWFVHTAMRDPERIDGLYRLMGLLAVIAFFIGLSGLVMLRLRTGQLPPFKAIVAWLAIFAWYAALARWGLPALLLVQLFHAIQYLEFPTRVEINRSVAVKAARVGSHMAIYIGLLIAASIVVLLIVPGPAMSVAANLLGAPQNTVAPVLILYFINIHHYFTDGVIWKISNPEVRKELFAHVPQPNVARATSSDRPGRRR